MNRFKGYKIASDSISKVEEILKKARENVSLAAKEEYHRLLSDEIATVHDDIILGVRERPFCSILNLAVDSLNKRIITAETRNYIVEHNLKSFVTIIPDKKDKTTYVMWNSANALLEDAFASTEGIEDYSFYLDVGDAVEDSQEERKRKWGQLEKKQEGLPSMLNASLTSTVDVDTSMLVFEDKDVRASIRARHHIMNQYLQAYSFGEPVHPSTLMRYTDFVLERSLSERGEVDMEETKAKLLTILPDIELSVIQMDPNAPVITTIEPTDKEEFENEQV